MGKGSTQTQTQQRTLDPSTQRYLDAYRAQARTTAGQGPSPFLTGAGQGYQGLAGNLGFGSQTGLGNIGDYYNPFQQDVIAGVQSDFGRQRDLANMSAADQATRAGAFGGSREAVLRANLMGDVNRNEGITLANVRNLGFENAAGRLMGERERMLQSGIAGLGGMAGVGQAISAEQLARMQPWLQSLGMGGYTDTTTTHTPGNFWKDALGVGLLAAAPFTGGATLAPGAAMFGVGSGGGMPNPWGSAGPSGGGRSPFMPGYGPGGFFTNPMQNMTPGVWGF
jgi:hypothetical protein